MKPISTLPFSRITRPIDQYQRLLALLFCLVSLKHNSREAAAACLSRPKLIFILKRAYFSYASILSAPRQGRNPPKPTMEPRTQNHSHLRPYLSAQVGGGRQKVKFLLPRRRRGSKNLTFCLPPGPGLHPNPPYPLFCIW